MTERYKGKRFAGFIITVAMLFAGLFVANENYAAFSQSLAALFGAYALGQSATDWKQAEK